ncbi:MAG: hypothetical protein L0H79_15325 [Intrasporangium sp.]|uniref:hypothetical protein n=1 Tax=Intrasporangium sp. TaxID=1925024 RepID=UPI0026482B67|nr:hypothetical protein [Intrasporangium sp.]MDN5797111.1 hypothetical protein [Intrasporangium sp.]
MHRLMFVPHAVVGAALLSSCTVPVAALAGIGVDVDGNLVGYVRVCDESIDGTTLYYDVSSRGATVPTSVEVGRWEAQPPVEATAEWSLNAPEGGWTSSKPVEPLEPGREYTLYGWTKDNTVSASGVTFTLADVAALKPGQVLHWSGRSGGKPERDVNEVSSRTDFEAKACRIIRL